MSRILSRLFDTGTFFCALILTVLLVRREIAWRDRSPPASADAVSNWDDLRRDGQRLGPASAPVQIVEFSDFQCPFCARFALDVLAPARAQHPDAIGVIYRHWPLSIHPLAAEAAIASECAGLQGRFEQYHDALFATQDSIGAWSFQRFARAAGVSDLAGFTRCLSDADVAARVSRDRRAALAVGAAGTPSFVVNGTLLHAPLDAGRLDSIIRASRRE
jgi:protein-disulfide isomerase